MDEYFAGKDLSFNFNTEPFDEIYNLLDGIQTPNMIANDMIADIDIFNYTISEEAGHIISMITTFQATVILDIRLSLY